MRVISSAEFLTGVLISLVLLIVAHLVEPGVIGSRSSSASTHRKQTQSLPSQDDLSEEQAMTFLKDYGYIEMQQAKNRTNDDGKTSLDQRSMPSSTQTTDQEQSKPDIVDFKEGIKSFQRRYQIPVTGEIDSATKEIMSKPRCGVPDYQFQIKQTVDGKGLDHSGLNDDSKQMDEEKLAFVTSPVMVTDTTLAGKQLGKSLQDPLSESAKSGDGMNKYPYGQPSVPEDKTYGDDAASWGQYSVLEVSFEEDFEDIETVDEEDLGEVLTTPSPEDDIKETTVLTYTVTEVVSALVSELDSRTTQTTLKYPKFSPSDNKNKDDKSGVRPKRDIRKLVRDVIGESNHRERRDSHANGQASSSSGSGLRFSTTDLPITWRVLDDYAPNSDTSGIFTAAFRRWAEVTPLTFREQNSGDVLNVDIKIAFANSNDLSDFGNHRWSSGQLAISDVATNHIFFNENKLWTDRSDQDYNLQSVAVHEIGHFLGLGHSTNASSIMYPIYRTFDGKVTIDSETKTAVQNIYGTCNNSLDTVFDWKRMNQLGQWTYTTYFVRNRYNWVYVNSRDEVKYAEPKLLSSRFGGVPDDLDAVVQNVDKPRDEMYFFKGNRYWRFNHAGKTVYTTTFEGVEWSANGRLISEGWPAKPGSDTRIPDNIDAAYYDKRDNNYYFFKGSMVYGYSEEEGGCCLDNYPMPISTAYPGEFSYIAPLEDNIDSAYYSIKHKKLFFFKGAYYWEHATFDPSARTIYNRVKQRASWDTRWRDICDVE
nr:matrix metallopeptidase-21-like [Lytechinus pictus]